MGQNLTKQERVHYFHVHTRLALLKTFSRKSSEIKPLRKKIEYNAFAKVNYSFDNEKHSIKRYI